VWATVDKAAGRAGIKSFLVEKGTPGFTVTHKEKKLGIRADDTAAMVLEDCRIPRENLLGGEETVSKSGSGGFRGAMKTFNMTRPNVAALGLGIAEAALDFTRDALKQAGVEIEYGGALNGQSAAAEKFIRLEMLWEAAMLSVLRAAWLADQGESNNTEASVCKPRPERRFAKSPRAASSSWVRWGRRASISWRSGSATADHRHLRRDRRDSAAHHCPNPARLHAQRAQVTARPAPATQRRMTTDYTDFTDPGQVPSLDP